MIKNDPGSHASRIFSDLVHSLENDQPCQLKQLYELSGDHFNICLDILYEWRIDRYYYGKANVGNIESNCQKIDT